jgi:hypothetical protein
MLIYSIFCPPSATRPGDFYLGGLIYLFWTIVFWMGMLFVVLWRFNLLKYL